MNRSRSAVSNFSDSSPRQPPVASPASQASSTGSRSRNLADFATKMVLRVVKRVTIVSPANHIPSPISLAEQFGFSSHHTYSSRRESSSGHRPIRLTQQAPPLASQLRRHASDIYTKVSAKICPKLVRQACMFFAAVALVFGGLSYLTAILDEQHSENVSIRELPFGQLRGRSLELTDEFLGVPYAHPPARFQLSHLWNRPYEGGWLAVDAHPPACAQLDSATGEVFGDEDCLYLNVFTPRGDAVDKRQRPVMVYLHGGKFVQGSIAAINGSSLAVRHDVIVVTVAYRLGALGFLAHRDMPEGKTSGRGNFGLLDQQLALRWVQKHIEAFGGDPERLMVFGQSAGAYSVCLQTLLPDNVGAFHTAVMESGACNAASLAESSKSVALALPLTATALQRGDDFAKATECLSITCLSALPVHQLLVASHDLSKAAYHFWQPTVDGHILPAPPSQLLQKVDKKQRMIMGYNQDDGSIFVRETPVFENGSDESYISWIRGSMRRLEGLHTLTDKDIDKLLELYPVSNSSEGNRANVARLIGDSHYICPTLYAANVLGQGQAYVYDFAHVDKGCEGAERLGAYHGSELAYVFHEHAPDDCRQHFTKEEEELSDEIQRYWTNLVLSGISPNIGRPSVEEEANNASGSWLDRQQWNVRGAGTWMGPGANKQQLRAAEQQTEVDVSAQGNLQELQIDEEEVLGPLSEDKSGHHHLPPPEEYDHHSQPAALEARAHDPPAPHLAPWPAYREEGRGEREVLRLDVLAVEGQRVREGRKDLVVGLGPSEREVYCSFWDRTGVYSAPE